VSGIQEGSERLRRSALGVTLFVTCLVAGGILGPVALASKVIVNQIGGISSSGDLGGQFRGPRGPAVNQSGNGGVALGTIYVLDSNAARVQQFAPDGSFLRAWGWGVKDGEAEFEICKVSASCHRGLTGAGAGQLGNGAQGIAVDQSTGSVYVSDQANRRIDIFTATGGFVGAFGWGALSGASEFQFCTLLSGCHSPAPAGSQGGQFGSAIGGIAFSPSGDLYVADKSNRRVDVFKPTVNGGLVTDMEFVRAFGWGVATGANSFEVCTTSPSCMAGSTAAPSNQAGQFGTNSPSDVAVDEKGDVFAVDAAFKRVQEFSAVPVVLSGTFGAGALGAAFGTGELLNVATVDDHVFVAGKRSKSANQVAVAELNQGGGLIDLHGTDLTATVGNGLAVLESSLGGNIYVSTGVVITGVYILNDRPTIDPITSFTGTTALFSGAVVSSGVPTTFHFEYSSNGEHWTSVPATDANVGSAEVQAQIAATGPSEGTLTVMATGGTFSLAFNGEITQQISYDASASSVQAALESLASVGSGNVTVSGGPGSETGSTPYGIIFTGSLTGTEVTQIAADGATLVATIAVSTEATNLTGSQLYHVRLVQTRPAAGRATSVETTFETNSAPPAIAATYASQVTDSTVTLNASLNPQNQETHYHFEYVSDQVFQESGFANAVDIPIPDSLAQGGVPVSIGRDLGGLTPATVYHFRLLAENATGGTVGEEVLFTTYPSQEVEQNCPNATFRVGPSARLPDCRAYELVSPVDSNGLFTTSLIGEAAEQTTFDTTLASTDGESVLSYSQGTLPEAEGGGQRAAHQAIRTVEGWMTRDASPSGAQSYSPGPGGISPDHRYAFWQSNDQGGSLMVNGEDAHYLRKPDGSFELIGLGLLGEDPKAWGRWITADASHVIFSTSPGVAVPLEEGAPEAGVAAIYDRAANGDTHVVSLLPGDITPVADAEYNGVSEDGSAVVFTIEGTMYERRNNDLTVPVASGEVRFVGISATGSRVFYEEVGSIFTGGEIFACDPESVGCEAGGNSPVSIASGSETRIVNVSADGSHVYFISPEQFEGEGEAGGPNLYVWNEGTPTFIATLSPQDLEGTVNLGRRAEIMSTPPTSGIGPADDPSRTTPDGAVFAFQSHANLTSYDSAGYSEIYLYDTGSESLRCISCNPLGGSATADAELEAVTQLNSPVNAVSHIANITTDGQAVFFETGDPLVPGDINGRDDVYEWSNDRVFLISSGRSSANSVLYGMTADGHDVFFTTNEALVSADENGGSRRIYDARVDGGFSSAIVGGQPCQDDACQGPILSPPALSPSASSTFQGMGNVKPHRHHHKHRHKHKRKRHRKHGRSRQHHKLGGGK